MRYLGDLLQVQDRAQTANIALPMLLAQYHIWLMALGAAGSLIGIAILKHYKGTEEKKFITLAKAISAIGFITLEFGAVGWLIFPMYQYLLNRGS